jgi:aspartyl-tRNA(Asn)/glutamyl-tRNA(Gln) amidotransferase subunit A
MAPRSPGDEALMDRGLVCCQKAAAWLTARDVQAAHGRRISYAADVGTWFAGGFDILATPSASVAAFPLGRLTPEHWPAHDWDWLAWAEFSYPFNLAHAPAISVPCGRTKAGLPVGVQLAGPRHADALVLQVAGAFLRAFPFSYAAGEGGEPAGRASKASRTG